MSSPTIRGPIALLAFGSGRIGLATRFAGLRAGLAGWPEGISAVLRPLTPLV